MNSYLKRVVNPTNEMQSVMSAHIPTDQARSTRSLARAISVTQPNLAQQPTLAKNRMIISGNNKQKKPVPMFLQKLYHMLESAEQDQATYDIVSWSPSEPGYFTIYNERAFSEQVIPKYFESSISSFKRQLNYYGFLLIKDEVPVLLQDSAGKKKTVSYRHEHGFMHKGRYDLLHNIRRSTCSGVVANDPKVEAAELRVKVQHLTKDVATLKNQVDAMTAKMDEFQRFMMAQRQHSRTRECDMPSRSFISVTAPLNEPFANESTNLQGPDNAVPLPRSCSTAGPANRVESTSSVHWEMLKGILEDEVAQDHATAFGSNNSFFSSFVTHKNQSTETSALAQNDYSCSHSEIEPELVSKLSRPGERSSFASSVSL
eukprot:CAMPEP_0116046092 /NCGR_PEP_ID=MMETSP0321-20121206/28035_1 /TAXON_ID=163516 /ORGANISM="Leptocylindrus danicus var. danicus, Strain B650" /LENGTH=372 /DNA_ID=CAMNT_0003527605 /DNA_START=144 /DNA_END=1262 /DNA_ORIENTATION=-